MIFGNWEGVDAPISSYFIACSAGACLGLATIFYYLVLEDGDVSIVIGLEYVYPLLVA